MKKTFLPLCILLLLAACTPKQADPVAEAIAAAMTRDIDQPCDITVSNLEKLDSTSFAVEFKRRISIYDIRIDQNTARLEKYIREGKKNNATKMFEDLQRDTKIFNELNGMKEMMADDTLKTAYYDYSFVYGGKVGNQRIPSKKAYATVTPDGRVLTYGADLKDIHKASGLAIPGYKELLDSFKQGDEQQTDNN